MTPRQVPSAAPDSSGRAAQRRRTRDAILAAAQRLITNGSSNPSIDDVAAEADVSRRTIYMHFPTLDQLLTDATSGLLSAQTMDPLLASPDLPDDPVARVDEFAQALADLATQALPLARTITRLTVDAEPLPGAPRRGYRRTAWIEQVLLPLRERLDDEQYARLSAALSVVLGWEAIIVLRDVRGLGPDEERTVLRWAAHALVTTMLVEAATPARKRRVKR